MKKLLLLIGLFTATNLSIAQNNSLDFDGINDFVQIGDHADFNGLNQITIEAWIYPKTIVNNTTVHTIVSKEDEWIMGIRHGMLEFATRNTFPGWIWVSSGTNISIDQWSHVAVSYNGTNYSFYLNGDLVSANIANGQIDAANNYNNNVLIGNRLNAGTNNFHGNIDEVSIWNNARTAIQIQSDMQGNISCPTVNLIANYNFNQGEAFGDNTGLANVLDCTGLHNGIPSLFAMNNCTSNYQGGFQSGLGGISINGNFEPCSESIETYVANGFHTGVNWTITGGVIMSSTNCSVTVEWGSTAGNYIINASELAVGSKSIAIVLSGDISIACNNMVNISVDSLCQATVLPAMVLEGERFSNLAYSVVVLDKQGNPILNNLLTKDHIGQVLGYTVTHLCTGNTCWGQIRVEDKWIPNLVCSDTALITQCGLDTEPETTGLPVGEGTDSVRISANKFKVWGFDPCDTVILSYRDEYTKYSCSTDNYAQIIRNWTAIDKYGNSSSCVQIISIKRGDIATISFPPNFDGRIGNEDHLECNAGNNITHIRGFNQLTNGYPSPHSRQVGAISLIGTGYPIGVSCDHIAVTYRDTKIDACGATYKLLRVWRVFDWCTGELKDTVQLIKVIDNQGPIISCPGTIGVAADTIGVDYYKCTATYNAPLPIFNQNPSNSDRIYVIEECSNWTYTVRHLAAINPDDCTPVNGLGTQATIIGVDPATGLPKYRIDNMPLGCNWIYYTITDDCGYSTECRYDIYVEDTRQPVAVCDKHTVVSLSEFGEGTLYANSVDNGSFDNCDLDSMAVRRMTDPHCNVPGNTSFGNFVTFCCEDIIDNPIMVVFRVWDKAGNHNDCMVEVIIQDKIAPELTCPADKRIECYQDYHDLNLTGRATAQDICGATQITYEDIDSSFNDCGLGWINRRWRAEDAGGRVDICDQLITIVNSRPFNNGGIDWPNKTVTIDGCNESDAHPDLLRQEDGRPVIDSGKAECAMVVVGFEDKLYYGIPNICIKIIRTWTVIDWCQFDRSNPNSKKGTWTFDQTINISNRIKPTILASVCKDLTIIANANCEGEIDIIAAGSDDCTLTEKLVWWYQIDYNNDGSIDFEENGIIARKTLAKGVHGFTWFVKDQCENIQSCKFIIKIEESKEPTPYCRKGIITTLMGGTGEVEIWASDFNIGSFDNCTPDSLLRYSFSSDVTDKFRRYSCDSLSNGISDTFTVQMWVTDLDGNQDFCSVEVIIQDNLDVCPDTGGTPFGTIAGNVHDEIQSTLANAQVTLFKNHDVESELTTGDDGVFSFGNLEMKSNYEVQIKRDDDYMNGVSTRDLVAIQKHLLGYKELSSSYKLIAADANGSESVSTSDISLIRKLILGKVTSFDNVDSWTMLPADFQFEDVKNPWNTDLPTSIKVKSLDQIMLNADFMAIKIGDVTGDSRTNGLNKVTVRSNETLVLDVKDQKLIRGEIVKVVLSSSMFKNIEGMQFTLNIDPAYANIIEINGDEIDVTESNIGWNYIDRGMMTFSWNSMQNDALNEEIQLFEIVLNVHEEIQLSEIMYLSSTITKAEAYRGDEPTMDLKLRYENISNDGFVLYQNKPNPFNNSTLIEFELPNAQTAKISVLDITGKRILLKNINGQKGINSVRISKEELSTTGILYYQLESGENVSTRKMLLLN